MAGSIGQALGGQPAKYISNRDGAMATTLLAAGKEVGTTEVETHFRGRPTSGKEVDEPSKKC